MQLLPLELETRGGNLPSEDKWYKLSDMTSDRLSSHHLSESMFCSMTACCEKLYLNGFPGENGDGQTGLR